MKDIFVSPKPKYVSQFASPDLVSKALNKEIKLTDDPKWRSFGFEKPCEYEFWAPRLCGLICVKMALDAYGVANDYSIAGLTKIAVKKGGYKVKKDKGWYYKPLIKMAKKFGLAGKIFKVISEKDVAGLIKQNKFFVASVHPGVIRGDFDKKPNNLGHLVLIWGVKVDNDEIVGFYIHNPSGREKKMQDKAFIPIERFSEAFAGRGFAIWKKEVKNG